MLMRNEFKIVGLVGAACLWNVVAGLHSDLCDVRELCRAVVPELTHGPHNDHRPGQPPQQIQVSAISTASSST